MGSPTGVVVLGRTAVDQWPNFKFCSANDRSTHDQKIRVLYQAVLEKNKDMVPDFTM